MSDWEEEYTKSRISAGQEGYKLSIENQLFFALFQYYLERGNEIDFENCKDEENDV